LAPNERCLEALTHANRTIKCINRKKKKKKKKNNNNFFYYLFFYYFFFYLNLKWCTGEYKRGKLPKSKV